MRQLWPFGLFLLLLGCGSGTRAPHLIDLQEVQPRHLEVGDRMRLTGTGFPEGRPATVTFRGETRRAGEVPRSSTSVSADAEQVAPHALELPISAELAAKLCGEGTPRHATFRGDVEVSFSPQTASGLPVIGRLDGVVIDFVPVVRDESDLSALRGDGQRFARFLGVGVSPSAGGLQVTQVEPQSRAARANLTVGDVVQELDGVVVRGVSDFIPPPNAKSSLVVVRRGPDSLALRVDAGGFRYSAPETLLPALFVALVLLGGFTLACSPLGRWVSLFERRVGERLRRTRSNTSAGGALDALKSLLADQLPESFLPYLAIVGFCALFSLLSLSRSVIWLELDVLLLPAASLSALAVSALLAGRGGRWSVRGSLQQTGAVLLFNVPFALFILVTAWWAGSLRVSDVVGLQGFWPWQWAVFRNPLIGVLAATSLFSRVPSARDRSESPLALPNTRQRALSLSAFVHTLCVCGVLALVGLGGPALPFAHGSAWALGLSVVVTLAKASALVVAVALTRWTLGVGDLVSGLRKALVGLVLPSLGAVGAMACFSAFGTGPVWGTLAQAIPASLFSCCVLMSGWLALRIARSARNPTAELRIQSWL